MLRLRHLRAARDNSLAALASKIGVHESTISRWESGESGIPDWRKEQLADLFGVSVPYLMGWDDDPGGAGPEASDDEDDGPGGNGGLRAAA